MALVGVEYCVNNWQNQKILPDNYSNVCKVICKNEKLNCSGHCWFYTYKKNVIHDQYLRKRSRSESNNNIQNNRENHVCSRTRTFSGNRNMHDKGLNVCVMPENMPELLLNGYKTKENLKWSDDVSDKNLPNESFQVSTNGFHCESADIFGSVAQSRIINVQEYSSGKSDDQCHRECIIGIKRTRDESPNLADRSECDSLKNDLMYQIQSKNVPKTETLYGDLNSSFSYSEDTNDCMASDIMSRSTINYSSKSILNHDFQNIVESNIPHAEDVVISYSNFKKYKCDTDFNELSASSVRERHSNHLYETDNDYSKSFNERKLEVHTDAGVQINVDGYRVFSETNDASNDSFETESPCQCYWSPIESTSIGKTLNSNGCNLHPSLRLSLFPNVPPYIKFSTYDTKGEPFPIHIHKLLRWKLSTITPLVVRKVVTNSGFRLLKKSTYWGGTWGKHTKSVGFKTLLDYQKMNHFPGTFQIGRKDRLWKSMQKLMVKFGRNKFDLMPSTYILPHDKKLLKAVWKKTTGKEPWIIKPPASARGTGIKVVHKWCQIPENLPLVVQKYISKPFLIDETKFDLRLYVLVTSVNPLRIYLYDNGLVRFASVKYSTELSTLGDRYMHLTNYSINKLSSKYQQNEDAHACQGHKWTLKTLWSYMKSELNVDVQKIWHRLIDLIIKTICSGEHSITGLSNANLNSRYNSYELFGIDVLFDETLKPWLLEVNISPSLHSSSPLDLAVKAPLVYDLMNIAGFQIPSSKKFTESQLCKGLGNVPDNRLCFDSRLYTRLISNVERQKHHTFLGQSREEYLTGILQDLTPDDVRHLIQYEDELTQLGSFQKIFPTPHTHEYLKYLESPRYYNLLFDAWETTYHKNREQGIQILYSKCEKGLHLRVPKVAVNASKIYEIHLKFLQHRLKNLDSASVEYSHCFLSHPFVTCNQNKVTLKTAYARKPKCWLRHSTSPLSRTYSLRSRKPK